MRSLHSHLLTLLAAGAFGGCGGSVVDPADGDRFVLPPRDESLDPNAVRIGEVLHACGHWGAAGQPSAERVLVDIAFGLSNAGDRPLPEHIAAAARHGATVLYRFNIPAVRARVAAARIPALAREPYFIHVRTVPDPLRYDWSIFVGFARPVAGADLDAIRALGGRITHRFDSINTVVTEVPDASIPRLRAMADVRYVEPNGIACAG